VLWMHKQRSPEISVALQCIHFCKTPEFPMTQNGC
jgi:hypothetical protein